LPFIIGEAYYWWAEANHSRKGVCVMVEVVARIFDCDREDSQAILALCAAVLVLIAAVAYIV